MSGGREIEGVKGTEKWWEVRRIGGRSGEVVGGPQKWWKVHRSGGRSAEVVEGPQKWWKGRIRVGGSTHVLAGPPKWVSGRISSSMHADVCNDPHMLRLLRRNPGTASSEVPGLFVTHFVQLSRTLFTASQAPS